MIQQGNTTILEIEFVEGILTGKWVLRHTPRRARIALENYIRTIRVRRWDAGVDPDAVMTHALGLLDKMEAS